MAVAALMGERGFGGFELAVNTRSPSIAGVSAFFREFPAPKSGGTETIAA
jgi:hypothetical protein